MAPFSYYPRHKSTEAMHKKGIGIGKEREMKGKRKIYRPRWNIQEKGKWKAREMKSKEIGKEEKEQNERGGEQKRIGEANKRKTKLKEIKKE